MYGIIQLIFQLVLKDQIGLKLGQIVVRILFFRELAALMKANRGNNVFRINSRGDTRCFGPCRNNHMLKARRKLELNLLSLVKSKTRKSKP